MAELNDKLITYGNLSTFYDKLQEQGLGGNAIEDVSVLPDASENKSKFFRLSSDDNVYVSELKSRTSTTTNRLPDAQQIDKAYLYESGEPPYYYKGSFKVIFDDVEVNGYGWLETGGGGLDDNWYFILTEDNAENVQSDSIAYGFLSSDSDYIDLVNKTITVSDKVSTDYKYTLNDVEGTEEIPVPAIYNAPESAQIGNATFSELDNGETGVYDGTQISFEYDGEQITGYKWTSIEDDTKFYVTDKPASEIYFYYDEDNNVCYFNVRLWYIWVSDLSNITLDDGFDTLYIPQLNAPDSEQVDNAYIYDIYGQHKYFYKGLESIVCTDGTINAPHWAMEGTDCTQQNNSLFTSPSANSLYNVEGDGFGCLNYQPNYSGQDGAIFYDTTNNVWKSTLNRESTEEMIADSGSAESLFDDGVTISTVKYQSTETIEEWGWQDIIPTYASDDDIDAMFTSPVVKRVLMKYGRVDEETGVRYPLTILEGLVNENDETMEYEGQTYYKWVKYEGRGNGTSTPDEVDKEVGYENVIVLTTSLNPTLPFSSSSPEWAYMIGSESEEAVYASPSTETYPKEALIHEDGSITYEE